MPHPNYDNLIDSDRRRVDEAVLDIQRRIEECYEPPKANRTHQELVRHVELIEELRELLACKIKAGRMDWTLSQLMLPKSERAGRYAEMKSRVVAGIPNGFSPFMGRFASHGVKLVSWSRR